MTRTDRGIMNSIVRASAGPHPRRAAPRRLLLGSFCVVTALLHAVIPERASAQVPASDIFIVPVVRGEKGSLTLGAPRNVTARDGYDNQPGWLPDGSAILYTSIRDGQADIYRYDLVPGRNSRVTSTAESEYSPTPMPDGVHFSVVRVETDSTQRLWRFPLDGRGAPELVLTDVRPVGYHAWADDTTLALFVLGDPATLQVARTTTGIAEVRASRIGRALTRVPGEQAFTYVQMEQGSRIGTIRRVRLATGSDEAVAPTAGDNEYHTWLPDGTLLSASETSVYIWDAMRQAWLEIASLEGRGLREITRLAMSPRGDWLALVATPAGIEVRK
jgi:hypothetical protein